MKSILITLFCLSLFNNLFAQRKYTTADSMYVKSLSVPLYHENKVIDSLFDTEISNKRIDSHFFVFRIFKAIHSYDFQVLQLEENQYGLINPMGDSYRDTWGYLYYRGYVIFLTGERINPNDFFSQESYRRIFTFCFGKLSYVTSSEHIVGYTKKVATTYTFKSGEFVGALELSH